MAAAKRNIFLAIDLGASNGRVMAVEIGGRKVIVEEVHRFANGGHRINGHYHWNTVGLFAEIKAGLAKAARQYGSRIVSAGVDSWGVDYGLIDRRGDLLGIPYQYRDSRTNGMLAWVGRKMPLRRIYEITGIQFMFFNTLLQLASEVKAKSPALEAADRLLFTPDLINFWLTGEAANEYTIASTSQLLDARARRWSRPLLDAIGLNRRLFRTLVQPGTPLGPLHPDVVEETGLKGIKVIATASHDTASAVAAVPAEGRDFVYLSSGTWSLMGVEADQPVITDDSYEFGFTNEGGIGGTIRLLKNICGMWLIQECRRIWQQNGQEYSFDELRAMALAEKPFTAFIDPDHPDFASPGDMPKRIADYCRRTGQSVPESPGAFSRIIFESLALRYREVFSQLEKLTGRHYPALHVVGGGVHQTVLNQFAADALRRPVIAGPIEATAMGNALVQWMAEEGIRDRSVARDLVRASVESRSWEPSDPDPWDDAYERFLQVVERGRRR
ncbi:MAG: rhamnulokinase [Kiritimatiellae bacterium]|nr:rhamnulokinase [Kiritimatiellia bacterium]MDW8459346.1 rhamnulokinase family protein [Verrucomicrobiota bacterium]